MTKIIKVIGSFCLAVIIVAIPFVCALSFALNWHAFIKFVLTTMTAILLGIVTVWIYEESEERNERMQKRD